MGSFVFNPYTVFLVHVRGLFILAGSGQRSNTLDLEIHGKTTVDRTGMAPFPTPPLKSLVQRFYSLLDQLKICCGTIKVW